MATPEQREIDWGSAEIEDATLAVELTGASSKGRATVRMGRLSA